MNQFVCANISLHDLIRRFFWNSLSVITSNQLLVETNH